MKFTKSMTKMDKEELRMWLYNSRRGFTKKGKRGKGSYNRAEFKKGM